MSFNLIEKFGKQIQDKTNLRTLFFCDLLRIKQELNKEILKHMKTLDKTR